MAEQVAACAIRKSVGKDGAAVALLHRSHCAVADKSCSHSVRSLGVEEVLVQMSALHSQLGVCGTLRGFRIERRRLGPGDDDIRSLHRVELSQSHRSLRSAQLAVVRSGWVSLGVPVATVCFDWYHRPLGRERTCDPHPDLDSNRWGGILVWGP